MRVYLKGVALGLTLLLVLLLVHKHLRSRRSLDSEPGARRGRARPGAPGAAAAARRAAGRAGAAGGRAAGAAGGRAAGAAGGRAAGAAGGRAAGAAGGRAAGAAGGRAAGAAGGRAAGAAGGRAAGAAGGRAAGAAGRASGSGAARNSPRARPTSGGVSASARPGSRAAKSAQSQTSSQEEQERFGFQPWRGRPKPPEKLTNASQTWLKDMKYPPWYLESVQYSKVYGKDQEFVGHKYLYRDPCPSAAKVRAQYKRDGVQTFPYIEPGEFIQESKNPCWYDADGKMLCLPYFYVAGVAKCGTTDIYKRIRYHPEIMEGELKEYHWWDRLRYGAPMELKFTEDSEKNDSPLPLEEYSRIITGKEIFDLQRDIQEQGFSNMICGDGSPSYLWDASQWTLFEGNEGCTEPKVVSGSFIRYANPESKIFLIFRHPTQRLYSRFLSRIARYPPFRGATPQMFHDYVVKGVACYKKCFREHSIRECAYNQTLYDEAVIRIIEGMYSVFVEDWLRIFRREQIMVIRNEDYSEDIEGHIIDAFNFLEVSKLGRTQMRPILTHVSTNIGQNYDTVGPMLPETIEILNEFYKPFVLRLYELLEDERFLWKDIAVT